MLNHKAATLYHKETKSALIIPPHLPHPRGDFQEDRIEAINFYLVLAQPESYVKTMWRAKTQGCLDLKWFIFNTLQTPQSRWINNPDAALRMEHLTKDLAEVGIEGSVIFSPPEKELCSSSRVYVRRIYQNDYQLGDYD